MSKTDEELLQEWRQARGRGVPKLTPLVEQQFLLGLRARQDRIDNPLPLEFCETCRVKARGPHRK